MLHVVDKLIALGPTLPFPHQSAGRSPWRAFYRRMGDVFVIAAVGPDVAVNTRGFDRATRAAVTRLADVETEGET